MTTSDANPEYWAEYSNLQHVKHSIIRNYLSGWFPKMSMGPYGARALLYIDTHSGRGKYLRGEPGSPIVALNSLMKHSAKDKILSGTNVRFIFIEQVEENLESLKQELAKFQVPENVSFEITAGDCFGMIEEAINELEVKKKSMPPAFVFLDPYGFKLPGKLLHRILSFNRTELFVNVIWRELDMALSLAKTGNQPGMVATLNTIFNGQSWKEINANESDERADQCARIFQQVSGAHWGTHIRMLNRNRIRYFLLHLTNNDAGRDLMKDCIWKACPDGGYYASKSDNPAQKLLIEPEPNLEPLKDWIRLQLENGSQRWLNLTDELRKELWLDKHLRSCLSEMKKAGDLIADSYSGQFSKKNNPLLHLVK